MGNRREGDPTGVQADAGSLCTDWDWGKWYWYWYLNETRIRGLPADDVERARVGAVAIAVAIADAVAVVVVVGAGRRRPASAWVWDEVSDLSLQMWCNPSSLFELLLAITIGLRWGANLGTSTGIVCYKSANRARGR